MKEERDDLGSSSPGFLSGLSGAQRDLVKARQSSVGPRQSWQYSSGSGKASWVLVGASRDSLKIIGCQSKLISARGDSLKFDESRKGLVGARISLSLVSLSLAHDEIRAANEP